MTVVVTHTTPADSSFSSTGAAAWNADHALSGVGTMAEQDANAVAITGGTINGTTVGATTAAAGTFTTLGVTTSITAAGAGSNVDLNVNAKGTGAINFYANASDIGFKVASNGTTGNSWTAYGSSVSPLLEASGASTNVNGIIRTKGSGILAFRTNLNDEQLRVAHTASAVNYVQVTGSATLTGAPTLSAQGSDANIPMRLMFKGNGGGSGGGIQLVNSSGWNGLSVQTVNNPNWINIAGVASGSAPVISALGSDTNIPLVLQPKGTGALQAQQTDSTATGGNARGANAVDWQTKRDTSARVASGQYSVVTGGNANTSAGYANVVSGGESNTANAYIATVSGGTGCQATGSYGFTGGGLGNINQAAYSAVVGGFLNTATGPFNFIGGGDRNSGTATAAVATQATSAVTSGSAAVTLSAPNAAIKVGQFVSGTGIVGYPINTYVAAISGTSLTLSQAANATGTPTLTFFTPHGVVVGGGNNQATGSYSFIGGGGDAGTAANRNVASGDWSTVGGGFKNTASGAYSSVLGGTTNTASGNNGSFVGGGSSNNALGFSSSVVGGISNTANANWAGVFGGQNNAANAVASSVLGGERATARSIVGNTVFSASSVPIANASGVQQSALLLLARQTTDATATVLTSDTNAASTTNQVILPNNSAYFFKGEVVAGVTGGGNTKGWTIEGVIKRGANAASTTVVGVTVMSSYGDAGAVTWTIAAAADTTNGGLKITATGQAATTIRWVCKLETVEMTF